MTWRRTLAAGATLFFSLGMAQSGWAGGSGGNGATTTTGGHGGAGSDGTAANLGGASGGLNGHAYNDGGNGVGGGGPGQNGDSVGYLGGGGGGGGNAVSPPYAPGTGGTGQGYDGNDVLPGGNGGELGGFISGGIVSEVLNGHAGADAVGIFSGITAGGGGGGDGAIFAGSGGLDVNAAIRGGNGGGVDVDDSVYVMGGGGGGGGGAGLVVTGRGNRLDVNAVIQGGDGGDGGHTGSSAAGGAGGGGGGGVGMAVSGAEIRVGNAGAIKGGAGGLGGAGPDNAGQAGAGGVGLLGGDLNVVVSGSISGGESGDGAARANAITFTGGTNRLELRAGSIIEGNVYARAGADDTLALGGDADPASAFDVSKIVGALTVGATNKYIGFEHFEKTGASTWTLIGVPTIPLPGILPGAPAALTPWTLSGGTLAISQDASLGSASGGLVFDGGALRWDAAFDLASDRAITLEAGGGTFDTNGFSSTIAQAITGAGGLTKAGAGVLTLNGVNVYSGATTIESGTLMVGDASHPSAGILGDAQVGAAGTLRGHGSVGGDVANDGFVWPGGSIGTLAVGGDYTQSPGGTLMIDVSPTAASQLKVGGTATLDGTLHLLYGPGTYTSKTYRIVDAGAVSGKFAQVKGNKPASVAMQNVSYTPTAVNLNVNLATAGGTVVVAPTNATIFGAAGSAAVRDSQRVNGLLLDRLGQLCGTPGQPAGGIAGGSGDAAGGGACTGRRVWMRATGTDTHVDGNHDAPDARDKRYGFLAGLDHTLDNGATLGLAAGYSHADVTEDTGDARTKLDTLRLAAYAGKRLGPVNVAGTLGYAYDFIATSRSFGALGSAEDSGHGQEFSAGAQASLPWALGRATLTPHIGVRYAHLDGFGLSESGPTSQNLKVDAQHLDSLQPYVGATLDYPLTSAGEAPASVQARVGYAYETLDVDRGVAVSAGDGTRFVIPGTEETRGRLSAGLGLRLPLSKAARAYVRYDALLHTGNVSAQSVQAGFSYRF